uniref:Ketoreductase (KR) domain-containing protein n=1 Tax=Anopheles coluzzii TaxID=1518534 RepID=A0A8W7PVC2_ANOCL
MEEIKKALAEADPFASWWPFIVAGIVFVIGTVRTYMGGQPCPNGNTIPGRVIVVTGATGGIGREVCRELARRQARCLILACRTVEQGDALKEQLRREAPDCVCEVSVIADRDDPLNLRQPAQSGRDAFAHSKLAIVLGSRALAGKLTAEGCSTTVNCCSPGLVRGTGHLRHSPIMKALFAKVLTFPWMWLFMKSPAQGAHTIVRLVTDPALAGCTGDFFNDCERVEVSELARDDELADRLYRASLSAVGLTEDAARGTVRPKKE